jgi:DNA transposition AAA+ family ATPase
MTDPEKTPVDVAEQREWLMAHKTSTNMSWSEISRQVGVPQGTLSQFGSGGYRGDNDRIAKDIFRFRQQLAAQAQIQVEAPEVPAYIETPTSRRIYSLLAWAQRGRMTMIAMGPGTGKSITCRHYADCMSNVWMATMAPSTAGVNTMQVELLAVMGERDAKGSPQALTRRIRERIVGSRGLILIDEAQHLSEKAVEEIRSWHDATGIGIALVGNESVVARVEGGSRRAAYAQLFSRIGMRHTQNLPLAQDARELAAAWGIEDEKLVAFVAQKSQMPGGLRGVTMMLELAHMLAASERRAVEVVHLQDAWAQLVSRPLAA